MDTIIDMRHVVIDMVREYGCTKTAQAIVAHFNSDIIGQKEAEQLLNFVTEEHPNHKQYVIN